MKAFLEEITEHILLHHAKELGDLCLVTPNRRAGLFFRKYFSQKMNQVSWAPEALSIEDFINRLSKLNVADNISLLFHFYSVYRALEKDKARPVDDFLKWAPVLLNDMDEIEANQEDPEAVYKALTDIKRIETWNPDGEPLTAFQKNHLDFYEGLHGWHQAFTSYLIDKGLAYQGLSSRMAARLVTAQDFQLPWEKVYFIGFNALNQSEELIIRTLIQRQQAFFICDADPYYADEPDHEAGTFIRKTMQRLTLKPLQFEPHFLHHKKNIHLLGIARNVNQARLTGNILQQNQALTRNDQTAIVLANEKLLIPVLNAVPSGLDRVNVTMGYPLSKTNMHVFFDALWRLQLFIAKSVKKDTASPAFFHNDLIRLLNHHCAGLLMGTEKGLGLTATLVQKIKQSGHSFLTFEQLSILVEETGATTGLADERPGMQKDFREAFWFLNEDWSKDIRQAFDSMLRLVSRLDGVFREQAVLHGRDIVNTPYFVDFEALYYYSGLFRRMQGFVNKYPFLDHLQTIYTLFRQLADTVSLSFSGEPLEGLQVMGMLETRNLDFKNVILLSANENILPRPKSHASFIPYDVKKRFGLLVHTEKDAIYAYHFYRLLQRAENVYLIYNTQTEDIGSSEKSRFLTQLQMELPAYAPGIRIHEQIISLPLPLAPGRDGLTVSKTPDIMERLKDLCQKGLSPSALNTWINCPLQFYFLRVARIEEPREVEETIEASTLGTVVHAVLEILYRPYIGGMIGEDGYKHMLEQTETLARQQFQRHFPGGEIHYGKNLLLFHLARRYLDNFIRAERGQMSQHDAVFGVMALEQVMEAWLEVRVNDRPVKVKIRGKADRIDHLNGKVRIIDYKTGKLKYNELNFPDWNTVCEDSRYGKAFQLLAYAWLYSKTEGNPAGIMPGIISMREAGKWVQSPGLPEGGTALGPGHIGLFETGLKKIVSAILDDSLPFSQTENTGNCRYCLFRQLCRRF